MDSSIKILYKGIGYRASPSPRTFENLLELITIGFEDLRPYNGLLLTYIDPEGDIIKDILACDVG